MNKHTLTAALAAAMAHVTETNAHAAQPKVIPGRMEVVVAKAATSADLYIYGDIGDSWWGESVTAQDVVKQLNELDDSVTTLNVYVNSYGGSVTDGLSIYNAIKRRAAAGLTVNSHVDGIAASIASVILCAGSTVTMASNTRLMVHAPWGGLYVTGNSKEVREAAAQFADVLDGFADAMANTYAAKTGMDKDAALALLTDGTDHWYSADQAKAAGFCDVVLTDGADEDAADKATARIARQPAFAKYLERMPLQLAAQLRAAAGIATTESPAIAGATEAAPSAAITEETTMPNPHNPADANHTATPDAQAAATAALSAMRERNAAIKAAVEPHLANPQVRAYYDDVIAAADPSVTASDVGLRVLAILGKDREPLNGNASVQAGADQRDKHREAMANAVEARVGAAKLASGNPYAGMSMSEIARACAQAAGVNVAGMNKMDIVGLAFTHSSSDFPGLLGDLGRKAVLRGYEEVETNLESFTRAVSLPDFNPRNLMGLGAFSDLSKVNESGEYTYGTFGEQSSKIQLATYGKLFSVSRQSIINDELGVFGDVPRKMGQAAKRTVAKAIFNLLVSNPVLADGKTLFHAAHGNLLTGAAISTASVDDMRVAMASQTDADGNPIRIDLSTLLTPVALRGAALLVKTSQYEVGTNRNNTTPNIVRDTFEVVDDPRLTGNAWYGIAANADALLVGYLDGQQTPYLEEKEGFTVDGVAWKVRIDAAPAIGDYRAIAKNPGA